MDDLNNKIEVKGKSGNLYQFVHGYELSKTAPPLSAGIFVFTKKKRLKAAQCLTFSFC